MNILNRLSNFLIDQASNFLLTLPNVIINIAVTIFALYYLLKDGDRFKEVLKDMIPITQKQFDELHDAFDRLLNGIVVGQITVALIQGGIAAAGFWIVGLRSEILLGLITAFFALIPVVGTAVVWFPASVLLLIDGIANTNNDLVLKGVFLLLYGAFIISTVDNFIRPKLISGRARVHPVIILVGVMGGIKLLGLFGIILGPVILTGTIMFIQQLKRDLHGTEG
jgi:predicted PurR-regulated permease PerM